MSASDDLGTRGEALCHLLLTNFCGRSRPYFVPRFLGDKFITFDFLVELTGTSGGTPFFFVQVKTTSTGYTTDKRGNRKLKVRVTRGDLLRMKNYPAPTYVIGIDEATQVGYIVSTNGDCPATLNGLPTTHELNCANLAALWQEVTTYWAVRNMLMPTSRFGV